MINPPFSMAASFIVKAAIEYFKGKNSILVISSISLDNPNINKFLRNIWMEVRPAIRIRSSPHEKIYEKTITVIGFLQPEIIDSKAHKNVMDIFNLKIIPILLSKMKFLSKVDWLTSFKI